MNSTLRALPVLLDAKMREVELIHESIKVK